MRTTAAGGADYATSPGVTGSAAAPGGIQWGWLDSNGRIGFSVDASLLAQSPQPVNDGIWHFIVFTRNATTGAAQLYLDGILADSRTGPTGVRNLAFQSLGRIENASGNAGCFIGGLDKLTVFNRVISAAEVTTFMNDRAFGTDSVFKRASDVERDPLIIHAWTTPAHGSVTHNGDGSFTYTATGDLTIQGVISGSGSATVGGDLATQSWSEAQTAIEENSASLLRVRDTVDADTVGRFMRLKVSVNP
jgi:hypothetical protein